MIENLLLGLANMKPARYLILLAVIGLGYYYFAFDDGSKYDKMAQQARQELIKEQEIVEQTRRLLAEKEDILRSRDALALQFQQTLKALPTEIDVAALVRGITNTAKAAGAKLNRIGPGRMQEEEYYDQLPIRIESQGKFSEIALFLSYIARMPRIVRIESFEILLRQTRNSNPNFLTLDGTIMGYRSRPLDELMAKDSEKGKP